MTTAAPARRHLVAALIEEIRPGDWAKNVLLLAPLVFGARLFEGEAVVASLLALAAFSMAASAGYVVNDVYDRERDRLHPIKRQRPVASGRMRVDFALGLAAGLALAAVGIALAVGPGFVALVGGYLVMQIVYTGWIKHVAILDVLGLGAFYVLRVYAGAVAIAVPASHWLLLATGLLAVFLGLCKRRHEFVLLGEGAEGHRGVLGAYSVQFLDPAISLTTSTALITFLLYATAPETVAKFGSRGMLAASPFVLYGLLRYLHLVYTRGEGGSPTEVMVTDPGVLAAAAGFALVSVLVVYL